MLCKVGNQFSHQCHQTTTTHSTSTHFPPFPHFSLISNFGLQFLFHPLLHEISPKPYLKLRLLLMDVFFFFTKKVGLIRTLVDKIRTCGQLRKKKMVLNIFCCCPSHSNILILFYQMDTIAFCSKSSPFK